jgi:hypothetical protein
MKGHAGYVRIDVEEVSEAYEKPVVLAPPTPVKKLGRPKKVANV